MNERKRGRRRERKEKKKNNSKSYDYDDYYDNSTVDESVNIPYDQCSFICPRMWRIMHMICSSQNPSSVPPLTLFLRAENGRLNG